MPYYIPAFIMERPSAIKKINHLPDQTFYGTSKTRHHQQLIK